MHRKLQKLFKSEKYDVQTDLPLKEDLTHTLVHYSPKSSLTEIDPSFQGVRKIGAESKQGRPEHPVSFFYMENTKPEDIVTSGSVSKYHVKVDHQKPIYDLGKDKHDFIKQAKAIADQRQTNPSALRMDDVHSMVKEAGYHGFFNSSSGLPIAVGMYGKQSPHAEFKISDEDRKIAKNEESHPLTATPHTIFSVENPYHPQKFKASHDEVVSKLNKMGFKAESVKGKYGKEEKSVIVKNPSDNQKKYIEKIAHGLGQDSVIHSDGKNHKMLFLHGEKAGGYHKGSGTNFHSKKPEDFYTELEDGTSFSHNFDFSKLHKEPILKKNDDGQLPQNPPKNPPSVKINPEHGKMIADAYENMKHDPEHPEVKSAYGALINETKQQYQDLLSKGFNFTKVSNPKDYPYKNSKEMHHDIENNKHLYYFPTESGFGSSDNDFSNHPMLQDTGLKNKDHNLLANDLFRIVHDINGHHLGGKSGFGAKGEHQAYLTHKGMYSPVAQKALATETLMQNQWTNFGPHGESNRKDPSNTKYADQKAAVAPDWIVQGNWHNES
jgi:hypothetical protein